ncbi:MAG: trypsin-like peptidase domain-containing protein [Thermoguttaceae bacterium]|jgi:hypothetical protein
MVRRNGRVSWISVGWFLGLLACLLARASSIAADEKTGGDLSGLVAKVDPCVVTIKMEHSTGSGFVIDANGVIATNFHVIDGAKAATVIFPDKTTYTVKGYYQLQPNRDMALLCIETNGKRLPVLRLAATPPKKGEAVYAFGAPLGMSGSMSAGIVAALRTGEEVRNILRDMSGGKDAYKEELGYDTDINWIQTTTPISPGNSGGPLVNAEGEVVGINTWQSNIGQNLNFTLSAKHLQELITHAGTIVHNFNMLPPSRHHMEAHGALGKTLAAWMQLNRFMNELSEKLAPCERRLTAIPPRDPRHPNKGLDARLKSKATQYHAMSAAYTDFATKAKAIKTEQVDPKLLVLTIKVADLAQRAADTCEEVSSAAKQQEDLEVKGFKQVAANLRTEHDVLRAALSLEYHKEFPTLEQTAKEPASDESEAAKDESKTPAEPNRDEVRTWTDNTGVYRIQAKFRELKDGKLTLERADRKVIVLPVERLSDADRKYIGADK